MPPPRARYRPPAPAPAPVAPAPVEPPAPPPRRRRRRRRRTPEELEAEQASVEQQTQQVHQEFRRVTETRAAAALRVAQSSTARRMFRAVTGRSLGLGLLNATRTSARELMDTATSELETFGARLTVQVQALQEEAYRTAVDTAHRLVARLDRNAESSEILRDREEVETMVEARAEAARPEIEEMVVTELGQVRSGMLRRANEAVARGITNQQLAVELDRAFESECFRIVRAVRTFLSRTYNAALADATALLARADRDVYLRWTEHVNDATGLPTDALTARDSIVMHGQVRRPHALFTMPRDEGVTPKLWDKKYDYPPNRPNDRAIVLPWRRSWNTPSYEFKGDQRIWLVRRS